MEKINSKLVALGLWILAFSIVAPWLVYVIWYYFADLYSPFFSHVNLFPVLGFVLIVCGLKGEDRVMAMVATGLLFLAIPTMQYIQTFGVWDSSMLYEIIQFRWLFDILLFGSIIGLCYLSFTKQQHDGRLKYLTYALMVLIVFTVVLTMSYKRYLSLLLLVPLAALYSQRWWLLVLVGIAFLDVLQVPLELYFNLPLSWIYFYLLDICLVFVVLVVLVVMGFRVIRINKYYEA